MESADAVYSQRKLSVIILAAGLSRRMGEENKLLLQYKTSSLILETIKQLSMTSGIYETIIVLGHESEKLKEHIKNENLKTSFNPEYKTGQTSSIQTGVRASHHETQAYMICLGDMPFLLTKDYEDLISYWNKTKIGSIVRPIVEQKPGHPVIFDACYKSDILKESYTEGCRTVIKKHADNLIHYDSRNLNYLIDVDKPSDKTKLKA